ncbi:MULTISPECIES: DUF6299 family protein [Streptomycetaceae]|uniref:DUF6299 domain-containing protein n=1 Tax=Streptantibioticus cattleyicolor (strain ATCC 35852 / DSM 46488 / JCM 4925 / NBRC 14057 / NRRL 8057) TaxID=1003195 RepID=F8K245_STREN|nr:MULTISPECIES: DUF6299 family protein [Streptomycetaceae]AEW93742.1 hypothetical protein SCATT_13710 [Streptantibioticus cattleyicolor NRRL 8057 = DSM 46488]MYS58433.1 hypothetical protein [Streptomyces sp. SID5468]CCB74090.1 conserved exported protein of unknown function [Streptantibioticus cattleyicolor NRRL 8057 = DSM 46488]
MRNPARLMCTALAGLALATLPVPAGGAEPGDTGRITVDPVGHVTPAGDVRLSGTYRCYGDGSEDPVFVSSTLKQHGANQSVGGTNARCDGRVHRWVNEEHQQWTAFTPGPSRVEAHILRLSERSGLPLPAFLASRERTVVLR